MGAGLNAGSFAGNFGSAFTDVLLGHRKEQAERKDKEFTLLFQPALEQAFQSGDFSLPEKLIAQYHPNLAKGLQKNSPFSQLGPLLQAHNAQAQPGQVQTNQPAGVSGGTLGSLPQSAQPEGVTGGTVGSIPESQRPQVGVPQAGSALPFGGSTVAAPGPIEQSSQSTFFGNPMVTKEQQGIRDIDAKVAVARRMVATGAAANLGEALDRIGLRETTSGAATLRYGGIRSADDIPDGTLDVSGQPIHTGSGKLYRVQLGPGGHEIFEPTINQGASLGADASRVAIELGYGDIRNVKDPRQMALVNATLMQRQGQLKVSDAIRFANTMLPNAPVEDQLRLADALMAGTTAAGVAALATPSETAPAQTPGAAAPTAPTTPTAPTAAPATAAPKSGIGAAVPKDLGAATKTTGKEPPPQIAQTLARTKSTNMLIDQALAALEPYKTDGRLESTIALAKNYRSGIGSKVGDIATNADEISQIADLAGLLQAADLRRSGSRAYQFQNDIRQHVPRLPSARQVMFATKTPLTSGAVSDISMGLGGQSWDSPQIMYEKLQRLKAANLDFISTLEDELAGGSTAKMPAGSAGAGTTTQIAAPTGGPPGITHRNGKLYGPDGKLLPGQDK